MADLLAIQNLSVAAADTLILDRLSLSIAAGTVHVLMGPNGGGKSTLVNAIMGHPQYRIVGGSICFEGREMAELPVHERARAGLFLSFQSPEEVPGIALEGFMRTARATITGTSTGVLAFRRELEHTMAELGIPADYASRYLNVGFSGGEKKKSEILQMLMLDPKLAILDETDSGLDVDAVKIVSRGVERFRRPENALLIITHTKILEYLPLDYVHVLLGGRIVHTGGGELVGEINRLGYSAFERPAVA